MQITYIEKKCHIWDSTKDYTEKKLKKLEKFFAGDCVVHVIYTLERDDNCKVEVTADYSGIIFRAQETTKDFRESVDRIVDILIRQIRKHKTKLEKRLKASDFTFESGFSSAVEEDDEETIIRRKTIVVSPMSEEEAILQMNMVGHDFFVYRSDADNRICIVYRRKDGNYGVIETE
ncbi:MAG: ribosome-associated translation inhibitor RaiA [Clostridia bacterium]|nr:ribosome-associated translation inhibitor RaiA [Clostridia bacterium]